MPARATISGTSDLAIGTALWIVIRPPSTAYYLTTRAPVVVQQDGTWTTIVGIGRGEHDAGQMFELFPVLAPETDSQFAVWVKIHPGGFGPFTFLPADATAKEGVRVTLAG